MHELEPWIFLEFAKLNIYDRSRLCLEHHIKPLAKSSVPLPTWLSTRRQVQHLTLCCPRPCPCT